MINLSDYTAGPHRTPRLSARAGTVNRAASACTYVWRPNPGTCEPAATTAAVKTSSAIAAANSSTSNIIGIKSLICYFRNISFLIHSHTRTRVRAHQRLSHQHTHFVCKVRWFPACSWLAQLISYYFDLRALQFKLRSCRAVFYH